VTREVKLRRELKVEVLEDWERERLIGIELNILRLLNIPLTGPENRRRYAVLDSDYDAVEEVEELYEEGLEAVEGEVERLEENYVGYSVVRRIYE